MTEAELQYKKMTETPVSRLIVMLGIPTTVSMLITNIYNLADTYFVGGLGESQQAATGILFTLQTIIQAFAFMLGHGAGTYVSKSLADRNEKEASAYASSSFFLGSLFGVVFGALGLVFITPLVRLLGSTETILPYAIDYGKWVLLSCPFMVCSLILNNILRYEGKAFYSMIGLTTGGLLNILGDYVLIEHFDMGVYGAGLSTAVSQVVSFVLLLIFYLKMAQARLSLRTVSHRSYIYFNVMKNGFPSLVRQGLTSISNGLLNNLTKPFGDAAIAAMSVVNRFSGFVMCVGLGIGQGFQPVASFNYRARKFDRVKRGLVFTTLFGLSFVGLLSLVGFIFAPGIVAFFQPSETVIEIGSFALRFACIGVLFLPLSVPVNMLYQSIRRWKIATLLSIMRSGATFIPTLIIGVSLAGLGGIQSAQPIADILTGLIAIPFMIHFLRKDHGGEDTAT